MTIECPVCQGEADRDGVACRRCRGRGTVEIDRERAEWRHQDRMLREAAAARGSRETYPDPDCRTARDARRDREDEREMDAYERRQR